MSQSREERAQAARVRMAELASKFIDRTTGELAHLRAQLENLRAGDLQGLADIRHVAHRMAGTGATLGFETLADCAMRAEKLAESQAPDAIPTGDVLLRLMTAIDAIEIELSRLKAN